MTTIQEQKQQVAAFQKSFRARPHLPVAQIQAHFPKVLPVKGPVWIAQDDIQVAAEYSVRDSVYEAIESASKEPLVIPPRSEMPLCDVHVEWIGQRPGAPRGAELPSGMSDTEIYERLQAEVENDATILFLHGGAFYTGSAASSRPITTRLARSTKARVLAIDYRLAPQSQFPAQLLDIFLVYLALQYPLPGSKHAAVPASKIIFAGESAGGGLWLSLIQTMLQLQRNQSHQKQATVNFGGRDVPIHMPAGITCLSAEVDRSLGLPSWKANGHIDFLQELQPANHQKQPPDEIWPSDPPRHDILCHSSAFLHPIGNPSMAEDWTGSPPMWWVYGEERCLDGAKLVASTAAWQGVVVQFSEFLGMPHVFGIVLPHFKQSQACMAEWAATCLDMVNGNFRTCRARRIGSEKEPGDCIEDVDVKKLVGFSREEAAAMIRAAAMARPLYEGKAVRSDL